ncbi:MAG: DUF370 domain-containing protein [Oscillospiraceae bacterium]|nr:DUF370 domain-containing protein [Oscillospiraceae bacterium]
MYIHLGNDIAVNSKDIVGIFDLENTSVGKITREFFKKSTRENRIINVSLDMPKSFVICKKQNGKEIIYITSLSCSTLLKRYNKNK